MKRKLLVGIVALCMVASVVAVAAASTPVVLTGNDLTLEQIEKVAVDGARVKVSDAALDQVKESYDTVLRAAVQGTPVYGLTVGVGWNKDQPVFRKKDGKKVLSPELLELSRRFNIISLRAHCAGTGAYLPTPVVRATMVVRLNQYLTGIPGVQPELIGYYSDYLNKGITPLVPSKGSVGQADITLSSHIGLAMVGEWKVRYDGKVQHSKTVMEQLGMEPFVPVGKDFLSILSTNALALGQAALAVREAGHYLDVSYPVFGVALEGYNGNVAPFTEEASEIRPFKGFVEAAGKLRKTLEGSYLWKSSQTRALQDPLSYRSMAYTLGNVEVALDRAEEALTLAVNHTDDNPAVLSDAQKGADRSPQTANYFFGEKGAIFPTSNFEMLPVLREIGGLKLALAKMSNRLVMQTIRLEDPKFTHLSRFLSAPDNPGHAFGAIQKPLAAMNTENNLYAIPTQLGATALAGNIEDTAGCSLIGIRNLEKIVDNLYDISSLQMLHTTQAVDLRKDKMGGAISMSPSTEKLYEAYRGDVPFVKQDRPYTEDIRKGAELLRCYPDCQ